MRTGIHRRRCARVISTLSGRILVHTTRNIDILLASMMTPEYKRFVNIKVWRSGMKVCDFGALVVGLFVNGADDQVRDTR